MRHAMGAIPNVIPAFILFSLVIQEVYGIYTAYGHIATHPKGKAMPDIPAWLPLCAFMTGFILGVVITRMLDTPHA